MLCVCGKFFVFFGSLRTHAVKITIFTEKQTIRFEIILSTLGFVCSIKICMSAV